VNRPREVANLFNPSFCSLLLWAAASEYQQVKNTGMPIVLSFIVPPLTLHKSTREALPNAITTSLTVWISEHADLLPGFADRTRDLLPFAREALLFGSIQDIFQVEGELLTPTRLRGFNNYAEETTEEVRECLRKARFIGRWFARSGSPPTILALFGLQP
jgi:hypothetical protein